MSHSKTNAIRPDNQTSVYNSIIAELSLNSTHCSYLKNLTEIIEHLPDAIFAVDIAGVIIAWNKAIEKMTGCAQIDMVGKKNFAYCKAFYGFERPGLVDLLDSDLPHIRSQYNQLTLNNNTLNAEVFIDKIKHGIYCNIFASHLHDNNGKKIGAIESIRDITARKMAEIKLQKTKERYALAFKAANDGIWDWDIISGKVYYSDRWKEILGFAPDELSNSIEVWEDLIHPDDYERVIASNNQITPANPVFNVEYRLRHKDGTYRWVLGRGIGKWNHNNLLYQVVGSHTDITKRKQNDNIIKILLRIADAINTTRNMVELYKKIHSALKDYIDTANFFIAILDSENDSLTFPYMIDKYDTAETFTVLQNITSPNTRSLTGAVLKSGSPLFLKKNDPIMKREVQGTTPEVWLGVPLKIRNKTIGVMAVQHYEDPNHYTSKDIELMTAVSEQVAVALERKMNEDQMSYLAMHDCLSGLPNRSLFLERLERSLVRQKRREKYKFAVMLLDLDRFKTINDTMGHHVGDILLQKISARLTPQVRAVDTVARLGGDEFAILLEEFKMAGEVVQIAKRILEAVRKPISIEGREVHTSASIGIVIKTESYQKAGDILRDADIAMYQAKSHGKRNFRVFSQSMHLKAVSCMHMENELRSALGNNQLTIAYQPIISLNRNSPMGFEALARWHHQEQGFISPGKFIPVAEECGLIMDLGEQILKMACAQVKKWHSLFPDFKNLFLSVNLSPKQCAYKSLPERVAAILKETGFPANLLKLEFTETAIMENPAQTTAILHKLKDMGIQLAIDDFGTGYSSLSYLQKLPVDTIKIDRSFVQELGCKKESDNIVKAILAMAESMRKHVIAEGVETKDQSNILKNMECKSVQGFYFYKPLMQKEAETIMQQWQINSRGGSPCMPCLQPKTEQKNDY